MGMNILGLSYIEENETDKLSEGVKGQRIETIRDRHENKVF